MKLVFALPVARFGPGTDGGGSVSPTRSAPAPLERGATASGGAVLRVKIGNRRRRIGFELLSSRRRARCRDHRRSCSATRWG
jgi:hypothetical protein